MAVAGRVASRVVPPLVLSAALFSAILAAPSAAADGWVRSYKRGVEAIDRREWRAAVELLVRAIEGNSKETERAPRLLFRRYLPYYYLGVAWFELGDCDQALKAFEESLLQGVVGRLPEAYDLERRRRQCQARSDRADALTRARESIERATAASAAVAELQRNPELDAVWEWREDSLGKRQKRAESLLEEARASLSRDPERLSTGQLKEVGEKAAQARWQLEAIRVEASQHLEEVRSLIVQKRVELAGLVEEAKRQRAAVEELMPLPSGLALRLANLEREMRRAREIGDGATVDQLATIESDLREAIQALRNAGTKPPRVLEQAVDAYFKGDYARALELLEGARTTGRRALAHLHLLRSAARYALFRADGQAPEMMAKAREDARLSRRQSADIVPAPTLFSPGFVEFYRLHSALPEPVRE